MHNVSILKDLKLGIGDSITVYKANMIIPQIAENLTASGNLKIPDKCPVCEQNTVLKKDVEAEMLYCVNKSCPAKMLKNFSLFVSRDVSDGYSDSGRLATTLIRAVMLPVALDAVQEHLCVGLRVLLERDRERAKQVARDL